MTAPAATDLVALLQRTRVLLLDFDGPICSIFASHSAPKIARELLDALRTDGNHVPDDTDHLDPFDVLRYAATISAEAAEHTHARLRAVELDFVPSATSTPYADELITAWRNTGRRAATVSNNAEVAVTAYVENRRFQLDAIVGRTSADSTRLKPSPHLVMRALDSSAHPPATRSCSAIPE